ncbi:nucleotide disphospho-sugar-binding domain-containing protein [Nostoc punctiforme UO1]|uniref:nucleotide disphospho-sugar-binding domain-containing protein n=1 Tax=Nostoc punctiforme TaxID=272131 RepID=UPI0030A8B3C8
MANIVFYVSFLQNDFNSTIKLAKTLKSLGHKVFYLGMLDSEEKVFKYGFPFLPILEKWFPKGFYQQEDYNRLNFSGLRLSLERRKYRKLRSSLIYSLYKGENREIHNAIKKADTDLLLIGTSCSSEASIIAFIAYECQIPTIYLTDMFTELPPPRNKILQDKKNTLNIQLLKRFYNKFQAASEALKRSLLWLVGKSLDEDIIRKLATIKSKIPLELLDFSNNLPLKLPHLFLCPEELDFPNSYREGCYYAEASIDLQREEPSFDWSKLNNNRVLIYCSLGTTGETFETLGIKKVKQFFQDVIDAVSLKNEYQLIVSASDHINVEDFHYVPENTIIVNRAPQLALLEKASLAIIHGGVRTIKECIFFGVPMIVFPVSSDQPENAERVEYHKLGVVGNIENTSANLIMDSIERIENDFFLKQRLEAWKKKFREIEHSEKATKFILNILEQNKCV